MAGFDRIKPPAKRLEDREEAREPDSGAADVKGRAALDVGSAGVGLACLLAILQALRRRLDAVESGHQRFPSAAARSSGWTVRPCRSAAITR